MRSLTAAFVAACLCATSALAAAPTPTASPLAPGKAAGVRKAQADDNTVLYLLGAGIVIGGIILVATGTGNGTPTGTSSSSSSNP